jgi:hypothetical protein
LTGLLVAAAAAASKTLVRSMRPWDRFKRVRPAA